eukprot:CAMPEP_0174252084 /NCGR_PEP_ID=MMETSP0439-20130205/1708_1 /TAXON_ID=0 /ORGANISM="Stereomyxa ramosa, Strain Chinc5" /LENGTH=316 /DNA_ID=CAMNT_0015332575 /DNA_START=261 /DNA_END=1211 /DNA_ORIENTATION=+
MEGPAPSWICYLAAFGLEWYGLMDNLDGRQARRTKNSSPLGQLFDHGCDCAVIAIASCLTASIYQLGAGMRSLWLLIATAVIFWTTSWEEYHTGTFFLGYVNGPTEGVKAIALFYILTGIYGFGIWTKTVAELVPSIAFLGSVTSFELRDFMVFTCLTIPMIVTAIFNIKAVSEHVAKKGESMAAPLKRLLHPIIFFSFVLVWYYTSLDLWHSYPHILQMGVGLAFAEMALGLILAHLLHMDFPVLQWPLLPLFVAASISLATFLGFVPPVDVYVMWSYLILSIASFVHFSASICVHFSNFLGIYVLRLNPVPKEN